MGYLTQKSQAKFAFHVIKSLNNAYKRDHLRNEDLILRTAKLIRFTWMLDQNNQQPKSQNYQQLNNAYCHNQPNSTNWKTKGHNKSLT